MRFLNSNTSDTYLNDGVNWMMRMRNADARRVAPNEDERVGHPRGTLAIVVIYALVFVAGWLALYFFTYTPRGPVLP
jgi:hypothetical protein